MIRMTQNWGPDLKMTGLSSIGMTNDLVVAHVDGHERIRRSMLKNLTIRTKIMVVVGVPMLALTVLGASSAWDQWGRSGDSSSASENVELAGLVLDAAHQVEVEGLRSLATIAEADSNGPAAGDLLEQRPLVDAATASLTARASTLDGLVSGDLGGLFGQLGELAGLRRSVDDGSADAELVSAFHEDLTGRFQSIERELLSGVAADAGSGSGILGLPVILALTLGGLALTALLALVVSRSISRPIGRLSHAADQLAQRTLPALAEGLRSPEQRRGAPKVPVIDVNQNDEIGQLASSLTKVQEAAASVTEEQASTLRRGISDLFVNLARRNQTLLDRQLAFIDELEAKEQDPDALADLFRLDHLATRMRRNAENLLVLAGVDAPRRRGEPVEMNDVLRVAIGEVEDYNRVSIVALDPIAVDGNAAVDIAHLTAELVENATMFSPPDTGVELVGSHVPGGYAIAITDHGIGMTPEAQEAANRVITSPPAVGFELSRSLGFIVVGHLAGRLGVTVKIGDGPDGGTTAVVSIPSKVLNAAELNPGPPTISEPAPEQTEPAAATIQPTNDEAALPALVEAPSEEASPAEPESQPVYTAEVEHHAPTEQHSEPMPGFEPAPMELPQLQPRTQASHLADVLPPDPDFDAGLADLMPTTPAGSAPPTPQLQIPTRQAEPAGPPTLTAAGLPKRVPTAPADDPALSQIGRPASAPSKRSPEEVRTMLARYRNGLHHGRGETMPREVQP